MNINQVAIIVHEDEREIETLSRRMHLWVAATKKNKATVEALWKLSTPKELSLTHYDISSISTAEDMCVIAIDQVDAHHSSIFSAVPWFEIQVHGCELTEKLTKEFKDFGNTTIKRQDYGFKVTRPCE
jgi:hypothetical protein